MTGKPLVAFDIEVYPNFFVGVFQSIKNPNKTEVYYLRHRREIREALMNFELVGFNSNKYDIPILWKIVNGSLKSHKDIKVYSDRIIKENMQAWQHDIPTHLTSSIDLYEVAPSVQTSLKLYGARMHMPKLQDLPYDPDQWLEEDEMDQVEAYCHNDIATTIELYNRVKDQLDLRRRMSAQYNTDLMSKSDAQIAESVFKHDLERVNKPQIKKNLTWKYRCPDWLNNTHIVEDVEFTLSDKLAVTLPKELSGTKVEIGESVYRFGIGGLHSSEKCSSHIATDDVVIRDFDVTSYYPSIILNQGLYPEHLGEGFSEVYSGLVKARISSKHRSQEIEKELKILRDKLAKMT